MTTIAMATADVRDLTLVAGGASVSLSSTQARTGTYSYKLVGTTGMTITHAAKTAIYARFAFYATLFYYAQVALREDGSTTHLTLYFSNGSLFVYRGTSSGTILGVVSGVIPNTWQVWEVYASIHDSTGAVTIRLNGVAVLTLTGVDTRNGGTNGNLTQVYINSSSLEVAYFDDIVVDDAAWPGLGGIQVLVPTGNGNYTSWTNDYASVDENPPNDDTDYVSTDAAVPDTKESWTLGDVVAGATTVARIGLVAKAKLDGVGSGTLKPLIRSNSTDDIPTGTALSTSYAWVSRYWDTDPGNGSAAWTPTTVNALEAGVASG